MEDIEIIDLYNRRIERAISETDVKYGTKCRWLSNNILNSVPDCEECVNDSYFTVWNKIPPEMPQSLCAFLLKIVRNLSLKRYEYNTAEKRNSHYDQALDELEFEISDNNSPEEDMLARELGQEINSFLRTLPEKQRNIFLQRYWYGCSVKSIASEQGMSAHNVTVRLGRIREQLRKYLDSRGYIYG